MHAESREIGWYARFFPLHGARHLGQPTSYHEIDLSSVLNKHRHTIILHQIIFAQLPSMHLLRAFFIDRADSPIDIIRRE